MKEGMTSPALARMAAVPPTPNVLARTGRGLVDLLFPPRCVICRQILADPAMPSGIGLLRRVEAITAGLAGVLEVQTYGDLVHIFVDDAAKRMPQIEAVLAAHLIQSIGLRRAPARMEEAFMSLIRGQEV